MDATRLSNFLENTYIPPSLSGTKKPFPNYHPCLIVQDSQTDVSKIMPCGCVDNYCVKNAPDWIPRVR